MTEGILRKMRTEQVDPVHYQLPLGEVLIELNPLIGQEISLVYSGKIFCIECGRKRIRASIRGTVFPVYVDWLHAIRASSGLNCVIIMKVLVGSRSGGRPIVCNLTWFILRTLLA